MRTVFITGAARGIGAATAERLHGRGDNVALVGLEPERLEALASRLGERAAFFEADVTDREALDAAVEGTVWTAGGCASWYIDSHGRNTTLWPGFTFKFRELTKRFDREHYELRPAPVREEVAA